MCTAWVQLLASQDDLMKHVLQVLLTAEACRSENDVAPRWEREFLLSPQLVYSCSSFLRPGGCGCCGMGRSLHNSGLPRLLEELFCADQVPTALRQLSLPVCQLRLNLQYPTQPGAPSANTLLNRLPRKQGQSKHGAEMVTQQLDDSNHGGQWCILECLEGDTGMLCLEAQHPLSGQTLFSEIFQSRKKLCTSWTRAWERSSCASSAAS